MAAAPVALGMKVGGSLVKGIAGHSAGKFNAKVAAFNKANAARDAVGEESLLRDQARKAMGEQLARQGGSGTVLGMGSNFDALQESAVNEQLDIMALRRKAAIRGTGYDIERANAKAAGQNALVGGIFEAGTAIADYAAAGSAG